MDELVTTLQSGATNLAAYLAGHVLLCLVPAFFIAGALSTLVPKESITRWLGPDAPRWRAYPTAAVGGSLIAVCSCTVLPLFASIRKKGAGLGPAVTFLFFAPAGNILALSYTGVALGGDFALARVILSVVFGIGIGLAMAARFPGDARSSATAGTTAPAPRFGRGVGALLVALVGLLLGGTLKLAPLEAVVFTTSWSSPWLAASSGTLAEVFPVDAAQGQEGVTVHGVLLIATLLAWGVVAWRGLTHVDDRVGKATVAALWLTGAMLCLAALRVAVVDQSVRVDVTGRTVVVLLLIGLVVALGRRIDRFDAQQWLWETWRFVRQIIPLLLVGVFAVGLVRVWLEPEWVHAVAGENSVLANAAGVGFGVFMYFPTLVEVPVAQLFMSLGMHPGPLLAYLMADPELSLQSMLVISRILGVRRTVGWVGLVAIFSLAAGMLWGARADGVGAGWLLVRGLAWIAAIAVLVKGLSWALNRRGRRPGVVA